jgi:hypothetical protein
MVLHKDKVEIGNSGQVLLFALATFVNRLDSDLLGGS